MKKNRTKRYQVATFLLKCIGMTPFLLFAFALSAEIHGTMPGGEPSLTFEDGGLDYFVMFNSLLDNTTTLYGEMAANPQGDTCLNSSSFTLTNKHVPNDAIVEKAYLIWMGAVAPDKLDSPTDNEVGLSFDNENSAYPVVHSTSVEAGNIGKLFTDTPSFEFEGISFDDDVFIGCGGEEAGVPGMDNVGYFTYRVDVTEFMKSVQLEGIVSGVVVSGEGEGLYGKYTVSDLECTEHDNYKCSGNMVSAWSLIVIYRTEEVRSKKLYFYNGLAQVQDAISQAEVSGFDLPRNSVVRQTLMVATGKKGVAINSDMPKEELLLRGEGATTLYNVFNKCNPKNGDDYEVYNSNASIVNWDPDAPEEDCISCVSGGSGEQYYGVDVDTFLLDAEKDINLMEHFAKGNTKMDITVSVNENEILTNFMMLSVDTKSSGWDIPPEAKNIPFAHDRELQFCACPDPSESGKDYYCYGERPFYYMIKVENWGTNIANDVWVSDELQDVEYVPGTAEIATQYSAEKGYYTDWSAIPDRSGTTAAEKFPLSGKGYRVADIMDTCDINTWTCKDSRFIRFLVKPKRALPKHAVLHNTAVITDASGRVYKTNNGFPLPLFGADCVGLESCAQPRKEDCGGVGCACVTDDDCPQYFVCNGCNCVRSYPPPLSGCDVVEFGVGPNSPRDTCSHIISRDNDGEFLVVGQLQLNASNCKDSQNFFFTALFASFAKSHSSIEFPEQQLIYDVNNDGVYTQGVDRIVSSVILKETTGFRILIDENERAYAGSTNHNFFIITKVDYNESQVEGDVTFSFSIDSATSLHGEDGSGDVTFEGERVRFATFMLEPSGEYFFGEIGTNNPRPPSDRYGWEGDENGEIPVMQFWMKSSEIANEIAELVVRMTADSNDRFGRDIASVSLYLDDDEDGEGDVLLKRVTKFKDNEAHFTDFDSPLLYDIGERKTFVLTADMDYMDEDEDRAVFLINDGDVILKNQSKMLGFPLVSETFQCDEWSNCPYPPPPSFCICTVVAVEKGPKIYAFLLFLLIFPLVGLFVRRKQ